MKLDIASMGTFGGFVLIFILLSSATIIVIYKRI